MFPRAVASLFCALLTLSAVAPALAHVKVYVEPGWTQAPACSSSEFIMVVPNERPVPTVNIVLDVPLSVTVIAAQPVPGWTANFAIVKGRVRGITWSGGQIHPREFQTFAFLAGMPKTPQVLSWNAHQTYQNGEVVNWTGAPGSDTPHSQMTITKPVASTNCRPGRGE